MATANLLGKRKLENDLENKPILKKHKEKSEEKETTKEQIERRVELSETKSDEASLISVEETVVEGLDETLDFVEEPKKTVYVANIPYKAEISDIIDFFKDVGEIVRVRLLLARKDNYVPAGFFEFASADEANKALEKKNGEYLLNRKILIDVADKGTRCLPPKYCLDHTVWFKDYPQQESLPIEEDETPPDPVEAVLFVANLSPQTTKILHIIDFFKDVAEVVSVRLNVNQEGKHVGYGFVEFASAKEAKWALKNKNGEYLHDHKILLMKGQDKTPDSVEAVAVREKTLYVGSLSYETKISAIINFFKDVGEVVHVRLIVDSKAKPVGFGFVEFASANEAKKALENKNGVYLHDREIILDVVKTSPYPLRSKYCIDHKVWYEDYLRRESLLIEEDAAVEGLDETPEEVSVRKKTVFVANISMNSDTLCHVSNIIYIFKAVGEVVGVRLIVDDMGEHVGCAYVEFASADEAKKAVQEKNSIALYVSVAEKASYPFRPKYNLYKLAKKLWYEDNLRREGFGLDNKPNLERQVVFSGKKITFSDED